MLRASGVVLRKRNDPVSVTTPVNRQVAISGVMLAPISMRRRVRMTAVCRSLYGYDSHVAGEIRGECGGR